MKVLGIAGSPRRKGNTSLLLEQVLDGASSVGAETEGVFLGELKIAPCQACNACREEGRCVIRDDMGPLYEKLVSSDIIAIASPIFFGSLSAQTKIMIDRCHALWVGEKTGRLKKHGIFLAAGAVDRRDFFENAGAIVKNLFATLGVVYRDELFVPGVDERTTVLNKVDVLTEAFNIGAKAARA